MVTTLVAHKHHPNCTHLISSFLQYMHCQSPYFLKLYPIVSQRVHHVLCVDPKFPIDIETISLFHLGMSENGVYPQL